jgi:hypothetical protein
MEVAEAADSTVAGVVADSMAGEAEDSTVVAGADSMEAEEVVASVEVAATFMGEAVDFPEVAAEASAEVMAGTFAVVVVFVAGLPALLE